MYFYWLKETFRNIVSIAPLFFFGFILSWQKKKKKKGRITTLLPSIKSIFVREINASLSPLFYLVFREPSTLLIRLIVYVTTKLLRELQTIQSFFVQRFHFATLIVFPCCPPGKEWRLGSADEVTFSRTNLTYSHCHKEERNSIEGCSSRIIGRQQIGQLIFKGDVEDEDGCEEGGVVRIGTIPHPLECVIRLLSRMFKRERGMMERRCNEQFDGHWKILFGSIISQGIYPVSKSLKRTILLALFSFFTSLSLF